ncbi:HlyD family secretion protein [Roseomonas sp. HJA6]|uniref:HlyD family secretion protein n=2 Tax=Roseomonas alba TaxID=2846776 RepID=A0ABS7ADM7_9PROT|nr:HlyD family secretion protein [Neoroseomonas alba]
MLGALVGGGLGGNWWMHVGRFQESTDNAYVQGDIAVLGPGIEGDVAAILVNDNDTVTAGQPLIRLVDTEWRARRDAAAGALAQAVAGTVTNRARIDQQHAQIAEADAQVAQAVAERDRAVQNAARYGTLANSGYGSRENADRTLADRLKAEAALRSAQAVAEAARAALPVLESECAAAEGKRAEAAATLALAERNLQQTVISAPFDGVVGNRSAQLGAHVRPGQNLIAVAPPPERQWVVANFKETQLAGMRRGQPVELSFDIGGPVLRGRVESLAPATGAQFSLLPPENATGNFTRVVQRVPVRIAIAPGQDSVRLRPGLSARVEVDTRADPNAPGGLFGAAAATLGLN